MTNFEKHKDKILELANSKKFMGINLITNEPIDCLETGICNDKCLFYNQNCYTSIDTISSLIKWLYEEYKPIIKPCPFCGKTDTIKIKKEENQYVICCSVHKGGCGSSSGYYNSEIEAIDKWNQRV